MIKRYEFEEGHRGYPCAVECDEGGYVDYDDHASEIARLTAEVERLSDASQCGIAIIAAMASLSKGGEITKDTTVRQIIDMLEGFRDAAWNDAIEAAAELLPSCGACGGSERIRTLHRPT